MLLPFPAPVPVRFFKLIWGKVDEFILLALPVHIFDPLRCFQIWNCRSTAPVVAIDGLDSIPPSGSVPFIHTQGVK